MCTMLCLHVHFCTLYVPVEVRRDEISWNCSNRQLELAAMWPPETNPGFSARAASALTLNHLSSITVYHFKSQKTGLNLC